MKFDLAAAMDIIYKIILKAKLNEIQTNKIFQNFQTSLIIKKFGVKKKTI